MKKKVLVIDDSAFMRKAITRMIESDSNFVVVGFAIDGSEALAKISEFDPDILTLDIEMPKLNGLETLKALKKIRPFLPVIIVSSISKAGSDTAIKCLEFGAFDFICKPESYVSMNINEISKDLINKLRAACYIQIKEELAPKIEKEAFFISSTIVKQDNHFTVIKNPVEFSKNNPKIIAIGSSTGGPVALQKLLKNFPRDFPACFIVVQHMPEGSFIYSLAERLNTLCSLEVKIAVEGEILRDGLVLIAPIGKHMIVKRRLTNYVINFKENNYKSYHCPSIDEMLYSLSYELGANSTVCILTGMGADGSKGVTEFVKYGGEVITESEESCAVYGMPRCVDELGLSNKSLNLERISDYLKNKFYNFKQI